MIRGFAMTLVEAPEGNAKVSAVGDPAVFVTPSFIPLMMRGRVFPEEVLGDIRWNVVSAQRREGQSVDSRSLNPFWRKWQLPKGGLPR